MTIAVDLGCKATNQTNKEAIKIVEDYGEKLSFIYYKDIHCRFTLELPPRQFQCLPTTNVTGKNKELF